MRMGGREGEGKEVGKGGNEGEKGRMEMREG